MRQSVRIWGAGIAAVVAGSVGAAVAVASPSPAAHKPAASAPAASTAKASMKNVRAWEQFRIRGTAGSVPAGSRVTLQQKLDGGAWQTLPASMNTNSRSMYNMRVMLGMKGHNKLRLVDSRKRAVSPVVDVWVR
ncbi:MULTISPECIES: hypothetical protein [Streptomyces]|uniref:Secreted protein n=3 Tax=Streptomyces TaxID=1883 RepID=A0A1D8FVM4_9ACTN|nr:MULTISPECIES: hypothetical protein [Streptomyces]AOT57260.1 hypothetical protein A4G23_00046 [Streptomyces rubrolavendulae]OSY49606.1 hypothetical protein BG846_04745 [Streptomyces fradiae ATCC 10745 = DSM 40063]QEV10719.1 hypothetical protein CP974_00310 [Streptomyces fradiae ATCC 10745 = DSM 40063]